MIKTFRNFLKSRHCPGYENAWRGFVDNNRKKFPQMKAEQWLRTAEPSDFVDCAFCWSETLQGVCYWEQISYDWGKLLKDKYNNEREI